VPGGGNNGAHCLESHASEALIYTIVQQHRFHSYTLLSASLKILAGLLCSAQSDDVQAAQSE
jgi:hypothetical protein